jgi:6-hydroxynicotinate reductase
MGGAPVYVWPGGGITIMVDVTALPPGSFGYVPTPALVAPLEFTMPLDDYVAMGGHVDAIRSIEEILALSAVERRTPDAGTPWPLEPEFVLWDGT